MKKLMVTIMVLCAAIAVQAETSWKFQSDCHNLIQDGYKAKTVNGTSDGFLGGGYSIYFIGFNSEDYMYQKNGEESYYITQDAFLSNLRKGQSVATAAGDALLGSSTTSQDGYFLTMPILLESESTYRYHGSEGVYAFMAVVVGSDVYLSGEQFQTPEDPFASEIEFSFAADDSDTRIDIDGTGSYSNSPGWFSITTSVPEPTSGVLLLIGLAGLALRRRRA